MTFKTSYKIALAIAFVAAILVLMAWFFVYPLIVSIVESSQDFISEKESVAYIEFKTKNLEDFKNVYDGLGPFLAQAEDLFTDYYDPIDFISFFEEKESAYGLEIEESVFSSGEKEKEDWDYLLFQLRSDGSYSDFIKFLRSLEGSPYLIDFVNLNISKIEAGGDEVSASLRIKVYTKEK